MDLRSTGSKPFRLLVRFHAYAGEELLEPNERSQFILGDGVYEETWIEPHQWRREVTFADYHAVEVENNGVRKIQASSDYEPSRLLMLMGSLFSPIPESLTNGSLRGTSWKIDHVSSGALQLVRLSKVMSASQRAEYSDSYYFSPTGALVMSNVEGVVAIWSSAVKFESKLVPERLEIRTAERSLLTATISIDSNVQQNPTAFDLPGPAAEAGMTLRDLTAAEVKPPDNRLSMNSLLASVPPSSSFMVRVVLDRSGAYREAEVLAAQDPKKAIPFLHALRNARAKPATINHSPCEFVIRWQFL